MTDPLPADWAATGGPDFQRRPVHRAWLLDQARGLFGFFQGAAVNPTGGFFGLDDHGRPLPAPDSGGTVRGRSDGQASERTRPTSERTRPASKRAGEPAR